MTETIKYHSTDTALEGDKHLTIEDSDDIKDLFTNLEKNKGKEEKKLFKSINTLLEGVTDGEEFDEVVEGLGEKKNLHAFSGALVLNGEINIDIPDKEHGNLLLGLTDKLKSEFEKNTETAREEELESAKKDHLEEINKDLDDAEKKVIDDIKDGDLADLKDKVNEKYKTGKFDFEAKDAAAAQDTVETDVPKEKLRDLLMEGDTEKFFARISGIAKSFFATAGILTGLSGNSKLKERLESAKIVVYDKISETSGMDFSKQISKAKESLAELKNKLGIESSDKEETKDVATTEDSKEEKK